MRSLLNSTSWTQPLRAPEGDGTSSLEDMEAEFEEGGAEDGGGENEEEDLDSMLGLEINDDTDAFLRKLWEPGEEEDDTKTDDDDEAGDSAEAQEALRNSIAADIKAIGIPESAIPEDFDPTNPKQLREVLGNIQRQTVQDTMRIMWKPLTAAFKQLTVRVRGETKALVNDSVSGSSFQQQLLEEIPIAGNPAFREVVNLLVNQSRKKFKGDPTKVIAATKKTLLAMNINPGKKTKSSRGGSEDESATSRSGIDALDAFMPFPQRRQGGSSTNLRNRLKR